ncbi:MAG: hypothetical protein AAF195_00435 [Pseudomonadota bacterium]
MTIISVITVGYLSWTNRYQKTDADKYALTENQLTYINQRIREFVLLNGRLPCPADNTIRQDNTRNATSVKTGVFIYSQEAFIFDANDGRDCPYSVGAIPAASLNISDSYMYDSWGNMFTYHVSPNLCSDNNKVSGLSSGQEPLVGCSARDYQFGIDINASPLQTEGNLRVLNAFGTEIASNIAYVLLSHGENEAGAYISSGNKIASSSNPDEEENSDSTNDGDFDEANDLDYVDRDIANNFDDIVTYFTKEQIANYIKNPAEQMVSVEDCDNNSNNLFNITTAQYNDLNNLVNGYEQSNNGTAINKGGDVILNIMYALQEVCSHHSYYTETANGAIWNGKQCPTSLSEDLKERCN